MSYSVFARYYDRLTENADYPTRADYLLRLMERHHHEPGETLDLACGTGTLTLLLKERGVNIFGADASVEMLSEAADKAGEGTLFICQPMEKLCLPAPVDTCLCTLDSLNHITSRERLIQVFCRIFESLKPDGLLIFDVNTIYKHREILGDHCYLYDFDEVFCAWQNNYQPRTHKVIITLDFFEPQGKGLYRRSSEQFSERAYSHEEIDSFLCAAGLEIESIYADLTFEPPQADTDREIYVVRKMHHEP